MRPSKKTTKKGLKNQIPRLEKRLHDKAVLEEELDVVKRFVYDLVCELTDKKLIDEGWKDTCEVLFDRETRKSLERSMKDAEEGNVTEWKDI